MIKTPPTKQNFLSHLGAKAGSGFQGDVYDYGTDGKKVVKVLSRFRGKRDRSADLNNEIANSLFASQIGAGPRIYHVYFANNNVYIVMEKVQMVRLGPADFKKVVQLHETLIENGLVNLDNSFGLNSKNKLVHVDFGVSSIVENPSAALHEYLVNSDYFSLFHKMQGVPGVYEYFLTRNKQMSKTK